MTVFPFAISKLKPTLKGQIEEEGPGGKPVKGQWGHGSKTKTAQSWAEVLKGGSGRSLGPGQMGGQPGRDEIIHRL